jgi:hypothetical protein
VDEREKKIDVARAQIRGLLKLAAEQNIDSPMDFFCMQQHKKKGKFQ